ncbi:MAG: EcsC family protein [Coleofasciculaceae cyanobacterium]
MTTQSKERSGMDHVNEAIATATKIATSTAKLATDAMQSATNNVTNTTTAVSETVTPLALKFVEQSTETVGKIVTPIAENQLVKYAAKVPGLGWLLTALGQVDLDAAQKEVDKLRQDYPLETPEQIAHRIIIDASLKAGGIGLLTNFVPPLALTLFAADIAAVTAIQAEMIYRIASAYGFSLQEPSRRGEVLAIFGLSVGGSGGLKVGLGLVELIPVVGAAVGASSNAALIYSLGVASCRFYEAKLNSLAHNSNTLTERIV